MGQFFLILKDGRSALCEEKNQSVFRNTQFSGEMSVDCLRFLTVHNNNYYLRRFSESRSSSGSTPSVRLCVRPSVCPSDHNTFWVPS